MSKPIPKTHFAHTLFRARDYQSHPQFETLCDWWRSVRCGVCAVVGIGGSGKTAIVERFIRTLPDVTAEDGDLRKDASLSSPDGLFVFSFYEETDTEIFFDQLYDWLTQEFGVRDRRNVTGDGTCRRASIGLVIAALEAVSSRFLLVMDGLEKVQDDGRRTGVFGRIEDTGLRQFLLRCAAGVLPRVAVLITTRFVLDDIEYERESGQATHYESLDIEVLPLESCVRLLLHHGVHGTASQLRDIAHQCGNHALTVDLAGIYLTRFSSGESLSFSGKPHSDELLTPSRTVRDRRLRYAVEQTERFQRLARRYRTALSSSDPLAFAVLSWMCLFRLGVTEDTLVWTLLGAGKSFLPKEMIDDVTPNLIMEKIEFLNELRLLQTTVRHTAYRRGDQSSNAVGTHSATFSVHPAVREGFLDSLDAQMVRHGHHAVGDVMLQMATEGSSLLTTIPVAYPSDGATLDLLEEVIYHNLESGRCDEAELVYQLRLGGHENLSWRLGAFERGERICRSFFDAQPPFAAHLPKDKLSQLTHDRAFYLSAIGCLKDATRYYELAAEAAVDSESWAEAAIRYGNLATVRLLSGHLTSSRVAAEKAVALHLQSKSRSTISAYSCRGHVLALLGDVLEATIDFSRALKSQRRKEPKIEQLYGRRGVDYALLLNRLGRLGDADRLTKINDQLSAEATISNEHLEFARCRLIRADVSGAGGNLVAARAWLAEAHDWALGRDAKDVLCWSALVQARIELSAITGQHSAHKPEARARDELGNDADPSLALRACEDAITVGLKIARDCGYGLYHIDLLLERARLHVLRGDPGAALEDIELALDTGIPANDETGQVELLAANHRECGYAWAIPDGLQLRAEALLLRAAQTLGQDSYAPAKISELPADVIQLIDQAEQHLHEALDLWQPLHDPEPERPDQNFQLDGREYNYRAAETHRILSELDGGILTAYPLTSISVSESTAPSRPMEVKANESNRMSIPEISEPMDGVTLPQSRVNNLWFHYNESDSAFVFIHGVLSDSRGCWLHEAKNSRMYWPALIRSDQRFNNPAIYLGGYYTAMNSGVYEISNCSDEVFGALNRTSPRGEPPVMSKPKITFICHSTGGIVARYMLTAHSEAFAERDVGLVLIASPSYGSKLADRLDLILRFYHHTVGKQLQWGNWSLKDLDRRFRNLVNDKKIPRLRGVEFCENHFIVHWKWLPFFSSKRVVTEESAGRYFGAVKLLRDTDHFSSVKPSSIRHPAHEYLLDFVGKQQLIPLAEEGTTNPQ